jgi:hypothetical protein
MHGFRAKTASLFHTSLEYRCTHVLTQPRTPLPLPPPGAPGLLQIFHHLSQGQRLKLRQALLGAQ